MLLVVIHSILVNKPLETSSLIRSSSVVSSGTGSSLPVSRRISSSNSKASLCSHSSSVDDVFGISGQGGMAVDGLTGFNVWKNIGSRRTGGDFGVSMTRMVGCPFLSSSVFCIFLGDRLRDRRDRLLSFDRRLDRPRWLSSLGRPLRLLDLLVSERAERSSSRRRSSIFSMLPAAMLTNRLARRSSSRVEQIRLPRISSCLLLIVFVECLVGDSCLNFSRLYKGWSSF